MLVRTFMRSRRPYTFIHVRIGKLAEERGPALILCLNEILAHPDLMRVCFPYPTCSCCSIQNDRVIAWFLPQRRFCYNTINSANLFVFRSSSTISLPFIGAYLFNHDWITLLLTLVDPLDPDQDQAVPRFSHLSQTSHPNLTLQDIITDLDLSYEEKTCVKQTLMSLFQKCAD